MGCRSRVLEQGKGRRGVVDAFIAFLVTNGEVQVAVPVEVVQDGNRPPSDINGPVLYPMVGGQSPQRLVRGSLVFPELHALVVVDFQRDVGGNNQVPIAVCIGVNRVRSGEPLEENAVGFTGVRHEGGEGHIHPSGAVLAIGGVLEHEATHGGVGDVGDEQVVEVFAVELERGDGASCMHAITLSGLWIDGGRPAFRIHHIETAVVVGTDEQGVVL